MNIEQDGRWNEEDGAQNQVKGAISIVEPNSITEYAPWPEWVLPVMRRSPFTHSVHSNADDQEEIYPNAPQERKVVVVSLDSHTVVDPHTVRVIPIDTHITNVAMLGTRSLHHLTSGTDVLRVHCF